MLCTATVVGEECVKYWCWEIWNGSERNLKSQLWWVLQQMQDDVQKSDSHSQDSERKKVLASPNDSLACAFIDLGAFWSVVAHLPSENLVLPYFSSLSMVAVSVPFPEVRSRKGTESGLLQRGDAAAGHIGQQGASLPWCHGWRQPSSVPSLSNFSWVYPLSTVSDQLMKCAL